MLILGIRWLWELHQRKVGGILGDEMGLGKTVQVKRLFGSSDDCYQWCPSTMGCAHSPYTFFSSPCRLRCRLFLVLYMALTAFVQH